jgi:hypothetical protein
MRKKYPQMRDILERTWKLLEKAPVKVPDDLKTAYKKVMTPDGHNWQPKKGSEVHLGHLRSAREGEVEGREEEGGREDG